MDKVQNYKITSVRHSPTVIVCYHIYAAYVQVCRLIWKARSVAAVL